MSDLEDLQFLSNKSREMLEKQIDSYRQKHTNAGTIIGVSALFIPFFLNGLDGALEWIKYFSILPVILLVISVIIMLKVLRTKLLYQFFSPQKFDELVNQDLETILLFEIGANRESYIDNKPIDEEVNRNYNRGVKLTAIAIIISSTLLLINKFNQPEKEPIKIQILNQKDMSDKDKPTEKPRVIPVVPPQDRERLNEGVDKPRNTPMPPPKPNQSEK